MLAVIGVVASVVGAFYYLRVVKVMWFDEAEQGFVPMASELRWVLAISDLFTIFFVVIAGPMSDIATAAARTFF